MALIIEVLDAEDRTVRARVRTDALPFTIGRAWDNDLILEDVYVDARHARVHRDADGTVLIEDLGSLNGLVVLRVDGSSEKRLHAVADGTSEIRLGRTILRFRDPAEPVPPALPDRHAGPGPLAGDPAPATSPLLESAAWRFGAPLAACAVIALQVWLTSYERNIASDVFVSLLGFAVIAAVWAGVWALAARMVVGRFNFGGHFAVISAAVLAGVLIYMAGEWVSFLFPTSTVGTVLGGAASLALVAAAVAGHMALASTMTPLRQWRAGAVTSAVLLAFVLLGSAIDDVAFSDVPDFPGVLKPTVVRWPAPIGLDAFLDAADRVRADVDALVD